jgi:hypothetical protein
MEEPKHWCTSTIEPSFSHGMVVVGGPLRQLEYIERSLELGQNLLPSIKSRRLVGPTLLAILKRKRAVDVTSTIMIIMAPPVFFMAKNLLRV